MKTDWRMKENGEFIWQKTKEGWKLRYHFHDGHWMQARDKLAWPDEEAPLWLAKDDYKRISEEEVFAIVL